MKAAIYCRVSTEDQAKEGSSLQSQRDYCRRKALDLGYEVPEEYTFQEVFSGADTDRPKLIELRDLIKRKAINAVVCYSTDRLARNPIHIAIIAEECEKRGIELIFVSEPLDKTPEGALIRYVKGYAAAIEREKIRERSLRGKREKARQGILSTGGPRLYGYDVIEKRRVVNDTEAEVIRKIFKWVGENDWTIYQVTRELNSQRIPAQEGGRWHTSKVYALVTNPAYSGVTFAFRYKHIGSKVVIKDRSEWVEVPGATPAIVSTDIFNAAQEVLKSHRHTPPANKKHEYLLGGGRLKCGTCGHTMGGAVKYKNGKPWLYYRCVKNNYTAGFYDKCSQSSISARIIEGIVWNEVYRILKHPEILLKDIERNDRKGEASVMEAEELLIENTIKKMRQEEDRYIELYGKNKISEVSFETLVEKVRARIAGEERKLAGLKGKKDSIEIMISNSEKLKPAAESLAIALKDAGYDLKAKAFEALDIRVTYNPDKTILIEGAIPLGAALSSMSSHSGKPGATFPFRIILRPAGLISDRRR